MEKRIGCFKGCLWLLIDIVVFCFLFYFVVAICFGDKSVAIPFGLRRYPAAYDKAELETLNEIIGQDIDGITFSVSEAELKEEILIYINKNENADYSETDIDAFYDWEYDKWCFKTKDGEAYLIADAETGELLLYVKGDRLV